MKLLWIDIVLAATIGFLVLGVLLREALRFLKRNRFERQRKACSEQLRKTTHLKTEELLGVALHLKKSFPPAIIEIALEELAKMSAVRRRQKLVLISDALGIVEQHLKTLRGGASWSERTEAAEKLGRIGHPRAVLPLIETLQDSSEDQQVRIAASRALAKIRDPRAIQPLVEALGTDVPAIVQPLADVLEGFGEDGVPTLVNVLQSSKAEGQRYWAARILARSQNPKTAVPLIGALKDRSEKVRAEAARSLGRMKIHHAVHPLIDALLRDPVAVVRQEAARALGEIGDEHALETLKQALPDLQYEARASAMAAMEKMGGKAIPLFLEALQEENDTIRTQAATALERSGYVTQTIESLVNESGETNTPSFQLLLRIAKVGVVESIMQSLTHQDFRIRLRLCQLLAEARNPRALDPLMTLAEKDTEWAVRARALEALICLGDERARPLWLRSLREEEESVRECMLDSLIQVSPEALQSMLPDLLPLLHDSNLRIRTLMVRIVGSVRSDEVVPALIESLKDSSAEARGEAAKLLGQYPQEEVVRALERTLEDSEPTVRAHAVRGLGRIKDPSSIPLLVKAFESADESYRDDISQALGSMKQQDLFAMTDLLMGLSSPQARAGVACALGLKRDLKLIRLLETFLKDPEPIVRSNAVKALGQLEIGFLVVPYLEDPEAIVRVSTVNALGRDGDGSFARKLVPVLKDPDPVVCRQAAVAIGQLHYRAAIEDIQHFQARTADPLSQAAALISLGLLGDQTSFQKILQGVQDPRLAPLLREALKTCTKEAQRRFFSLLALDDPHLFWQEESIERCEKVIEHYRSLIRSSREPANRVRALQALSFLRQSECVPTLETSLAKDPDPEVRSQALVCLSNFLDMQELLKKLVVALRDPASEVRLQAAQILRRVEPKEVEPHKELLLELLDTQNGVLQQAVSELLSECYQRDLKAFADILMGTKQKHLSLGLIRTLGLMRDPVVGGLLLSFLKHKDPEIRQLAAEQLPQVSSHLAKESLLRYIEDPDEKVRLAILRCLEKQFGSYLVKPLMERIMDPSPRVRQEVAVAFGSVILNDERPVQGLMRMIQDRSPLVRVQALISLMRLRVPNCSRIYRQTSTTLDEAALAQLRESLEKEGIVSQTLKILKTDPSAQNRSDALNLLAQVDLGKYIQDIASALKDPNHSVRVAAVEALVPYEDADIQKAIESLAQDPIEAVRSAVARKQLRTVSVPREK